MSLQTHGGHVIDRIHAGDSGFFYAHHLYMGTTYRVC